MRLSVSRQSIAAPGVGLRHEDAVPENETLLALLVLNLRYVHEVINHVEGYVRDHIHTNGIENFWSVLKRGLNGTYVSVEPFHLERYVGEQVFRFNNRATKDTPLSDADRFVLAMSQISGKRLTYAALTGKVPPSC